MDYKVLNQKIKIAVPELANDLQILSVEDVVNLSQKDESLKQIYNFYWQYLSKPHKLLGREGAVCPFIPLALKFKKVHTITIPNNSINEEDVKTLMRLLLTTLDSLNEGKEESTFVVFFTNKKIAADFVLKLQKDLKPEFVKQGFMIGEFFLGNSSPGLRNANFFPLQSPIPALAVRVMIKEDLPFMQKMEYSANELKYFLAMYNKQFPTPHRFHIKILPSLLLFGLVCCLAMLCKLYL